jgi:hypothetical protein
MFRFVFPVLKRLSFLRNGVKSDTNYALVWRCHSILCGSETARDHLFLFVSLFRNEKGIALCYLQNDFSAAVS